MSHKIAALYVDEKGVYSGLPDVDVWGISRDARKYAGPWPVVAHPPCHLWTNMASVNYKRWGGEHNRPGNDGGCFRSALVSVMKFGGVLEHPAFSRAWGAYRLARPSGIGWMATSGEDWVCEVWQSAYGHQARKRTWLFYHGRNPPLELNWNRPSGTHQIGEHDQRGKERNKPTISGKRASRTPEPFRDILLSIARSIPLADRRIRDGLAETIGLVLLVTAVKLLLHNG
jgi:hypothetical protein